MKTVFCLAVAIVLLLVLQTDLLPWKLVASAELKKTQDELVDLRSQLAQHKQQQKAAAATVSEGQWMRDPRRRGPLDKGAYDNQSARYQGF